MYEFINNILSIKKGDCSYFFDPDTLLVFSKNTKQATDRDVIKNYLENKGKLLKEKKITQPRVLPDSSNISLDLHVTNNCNLRCKYCYMDEECTKERKKQMSEEVIEKSFLFTLKNFPKAEFLRISLWGGEPLLFWDKFDFILKKSKEIFKNKKVKFSFSTNGTFFNDEILDFIKKNNFSVQISLDGPENYQDFLRPTFQNKGTYKKIIENITYLKKNGINFFSSRSTITPYNMNLKELFLFFRESGFQKSTFGLCCSTHNDMAIKEEHLPILQRNLEELAQCYLQDLVQQKEKTFSFYFFERILKNLHSGKKKLTFCGIGKSLFAISPEGSIYPCHRFIGDNQHKIGDINLGFFEDKDIRNPLMNLHVDNKINCKDCFARYLCGGGCAHENFCSFDKISCQFRKHVIYLAIWIYAELQTKHRSVLSRWDTKKKI